VLLVLIGFCFFHVQLSQGSRRYVDYVGLNQGNQNDLNIAQTYGTAASVVYDAIYVPDGNENAFIILTENTTAFLYEEPAIFVLEQFRRGKPIAASGKSFELLQNARLPGNVLSNNTKTQIEYGVFVGDAGKLQDNFKNALIRRRYWNRFPLDPNATKSLTAINDTKSS
jgi:catalase